MQPHAQKAGASSVHLHACSNTLSSHSTSACPLITPLMALLTGAVLLAGSEPEEVQQVIVRLRGGRLPRSLKTRPPAGARASNHPMHAEHAAECSLPVLCGVLQLPCSCAGRVAECRARRSRGALRWRCGCRRRSEGDQRRRLQLLRMSQGCSCRPAGWRRRQQSKERGAGLLWWLGNRRCTCACVIWSGAAV